MRTLYSIILLILSVISVLTINSEVTYASNKCWYSFSSDCENTTPPYCTDGKCTLSGGLDAANDAVNGTLTDKPLSVFIQEIVTYFLGFVTLIAVLYVIYAGFQIMTGAGDEEKNKKGKNIITYVIIGIVIMWLAYGIVDIIVSSVEKKTTVKDGERHYLWSIIPTASAAPYSETSSDSFLEYKDKLRIAIQDLENELRIQKKVEISNIQNIKNLVQGAYDRLPDFGEVGAQNDTMKRATDRDLELAMKNPSSTSQVGTAISSVASFISSARIESIQGSINANPGEGHAPVTVSFEATGIKDPSGATPDQMSYIWWMRENGGIRREIGRGKSLVYTFQQEGTYTVFLDVISGSRNSKKKVDVLPLTASKIIDVKPRLGDVTLLINGVNVSSLDSLKINPTIGKMGIIFDATASRATGGNITKSEWRFDNGNSITYNGPPIVERQIFANNGTYDVGLTLTTNNGQVFTKNIRLIVRSPSAVIQTDSLVGNVGNEMNFSSKSYFTNTANVEYSWQIQDDNNKKIINNFPGGSLRHTFDKIGTYIVTLNARSPNGDIDTDSRQITIESRAPIVNLESPRSISNEKPNTMVFDATKSYDPDTMGRKGLTYSWYLDGEKVNLDNPTDDGAKGELTFDKKGHHTIGITVVNNYGKITKSEKNFEVTSILSANMLITPRVAPIGTSINFIAQSENGHFFEWNMGDGSPIKTGNKKIVQHTYAKSGIYDITLKVSGEATSESNSIQRRIYVTNSGSPFALISISNPSSTVYYDPNACGSGATVINRSDITTFDGSKSINIDGSNANLTYTWNYFGQVKTTPILTEKMKDIGCYPIKLTVRSNTNGATHTSTEFIAVKNIPPQITSLSTNVDTAKKDSQKVLVRVSANGARDPDGVITSYIWYYTTESDQEPQNVQITQTPEITFVLPNITEKYYFGVIIEDNNGAKTNSIDDGNEQVPLILDNQQSNIYMPLITLNTPKNTVLAGESLKMSVEAKTIVGTNITKAAEYAWDFDGDGRFEEKTSNPTVNYTYKNSGTYSIKVRATYNGVSNIKYTTISVKNPLKAQASMYSLPDGSIYILNTTEGLYDTATWVIDGESTESKKSLLISSEQARTISGSTLGVLRASLGTTDTSTFILDRASLITIDSSKGVNYQSSPSAVDDTIYIQGSSDQLNISLIGNNADYYKIDSDTKIDSDLDGIPDNDIDNKDQASYTDGSIYSITDFSETRTRDRSIRVSIVKNGLETSKDIKLVFSFMPESSTVSGESEFLSLGESINDFDRKKLEELVTLIRSIEGSDRVVLMQDYNILIENWSDSFSKAKSLIDLQDTLNKTTIEETKKVQISAILDSLLIGDSATIDDVTIATKLIKDLIPESSPNKLVILEKLSQISSHPTNLTENKILGKEILELVKNDTTIEDTYKIHIRNQLLIIINGGQANVSPDEVENGDKGEKSNSILGFISGIVWVFGFIIGGILLVILLGYIFYIIGRKNEDIGFQDFLIDSVFHNRKPDEQKGTGTSVDLSSVIIKEPVITPITVHPENIKTDPLLSYTPPIVTTPPTDPLSTSEATIITAPVQTESSIPSWLQIPQTSVEPSTPSSTQTSSEDQQLTINKEFNTHTDSLNEEVTKTPEGPIDTPISTRSDIPTNTPDLGDIQSPITTVPNEQIDIDGTQSTDPTNNTTGTEAQLPDWLVDSLKTESISISEPTKTSNTAPQDTPTQDTSTQDTSTQDASTQDASTQDASTQDTPNSIIKRKSKKVKSKPINDNTHQDVSSEDIPDWLK